MKKIIVTNNKYVYEKYKDDFEVYFDESFSYIEVLKYVRDRVHEGHKLLTHPLSGSVKPNETVYKSIMISDKKDVLDFDSLKLIEESIATAKKFTANKPTPDWSESILDDFRILDLSLIENVIDKLKHA